MIAIEVALLREVPGIATGHPVVIQREVENIVGVAVNHEVAANHVIAIGTDVEVEVDQEKTKNPLQLQIHIRMNVIPRLRTVLDLRYHQPPVIPAKHLLYRLDTLIQFSIKCLQYQTI